MAFPKRHLKILAQYRPLQRLALLAAVRMGRWLDGRGAFYLESKRVFDHAFAEGYEFHRRGDRNLLEMHDPEIGPCRVTLRRGTSDFAVFVQCLITRQYRPLVQLVRHCRDPAEVRVIIDAGANVGLTALYLARSFPAARVLCLEPERTNYDLCCLNVTANRLDNVVVERAALWNDDVPVRVLPGIRDGREWSFRVGGAESPGRSDDRVEGLRVRTLMERHGLESVDIMKIDIEGAEEPLFGARDDVASWLPRTRFVALEIHDPEAHRFIVPLLEGHGFFVFHHGELTMAVRRDLVAPARLLDYFKLLFTPRPDEGRLRLRH